MWPLAALLADLSTSDDWYAAWRALPDERRNPIRTYTALRHDRRRAAGGAAGCPATARRTVAFMGYWRKGHCGS